MTASTDLLTDNVRAQDVGDHGRTTVSPRALERLVSAVTADTFAVTARAVQVTLSDRGGLLALEIRTPVRTASLNRVSQHPAVVETSGGTLMQRTSDAQTTILQRVSELSGAQIAHITVRLTGISTQEESRVR